MDLAKIGGIASKVKAGTPLTADEVKALEEYARKPYIGPKARTIPGKGAGEAELREWVDFLSKSTDAQIKASLAAGYDPGAGKATPEIVTKFDAKKAKADAEAALAEKTRATKAWAESPGVPPPVPPPPAAKPVVAAPAPIAPKPVAPAAMAIPRELAPVIKSGVVPQPKADYTPPASIVNAPGAAPVAPPKLGGPGENPAGALDPDSPAFARWLQEIQKKGDLVAENPMYTKAWDTMTPDEMARLKTENPNYYKKFLGELEGGLTPAATKYDKPGPENTGGRVKAPGGGGQAGGGPLDPLPPKALVEKTAEGVPDWLMRLGEVLQAGAAGAAGITDMAKTAYGARVAKEAEKAKSESENAFYEKMKALDFDYQARAAASAQAAERALAELQLQAQKEMAEAGRVSDLTLAKLSEANANYRAKLQLDASKAAATGGGLGVPYEARLAEYLGGGSK